MSVVFSAYQKSLVSRGFDDGLWGRDPAALVPAGLTAEKDYMLGHRLGSEAASALADLQRTQDHRP